MKSLSLLFFVSIIVFSVASGCLENNMSDRPDSPFISNVGVVSSSIDDGFELKLTVYVDNPGITDTGSLHLKITSKDPMTNQIMVENVENIGYLKAKSNSYKLLTFNVPTTGKQQIEIELFEGDVLKSQHSTIIKLMGERDSSFSGVRLTDLSVETKQATNYGKDIVVTVAPGISNEGTGTVESLNVVITAISDPYTEHSSSIIVTDLKSGQKTRADLEMTLPAADAYKFKVDLFADGKNIMSTQTNSFIKIHDMRTNIPIIHPLLESDVPVEEEADEEAVEESPGFSVVLMGMMLVLTFVVLHKKNG